MSYYFIANIKINNPADYDKYLEHIDEIFSKYKGKYLAVDSCPTVLEGKWDYTKSVLIKFHSKREFKYWYYSEDYQKILKFRLGSATCDTILIKGLD